MVPMGVLGVRMGVWVVWSVWGCGGPIGVWGCWGSYWCLGVLLLLLGRGCSMWGCRVCGVRRAVSLCGSVLCVALLFLTCWFYALPALCMAAMLYKYVQFCGSVRPPKPSPPPTPNPALLVPTSNYAPPPLSSLAAL